MVQLEGYNDSTIMPQLVAVIRLRIKSNQKLSLKFAINLRELYQYSFYVPESTGYLLGNYVFFIHCVNDNWRWNTISPSLIRNHLQLLLQFLHFLSLQL